MNVIFIQTYCHATIQWELRRKRETPNISTCSFYYRTTHAWIYVAKRKCPFFDLSTEMHIYKHWNSRATLKTLLPSLYPCWFIQSTHFIKFNVIWSMVSACYFTYTLNAACCFPCARNRLSLRFSIIPDMGFVLLKCTLFKCLKWNWWISRWNSEHGI